jgi:TPR repeat protein
LGHKRTCPSKLSFFLDEAFYHCLSRAISYYKKAAEQGDKRAAQRLKGSQNQAMLQPGGPGAILHRNSDGDSSKNGKDKDCVIM